MDVEFGRRNWRESNRVQIEEHVTERDQLEVKIRQLEMSKKEAEMIIVRLRHQKEEQQKCYEFQLQQQLKSEEQRIKSANRNLER